jgi:hypothetical protein
MKIVGVPNEPGKEVEQYDPDYPELQPEVHSMKLFKSHVYI